jgi:hypothetical protein
MKPSDIDKSELHSYFRNYVNLVPEFDILEALEYSSNHLLNLIKQLDESQLTFRYEEDKWSIKEILVHIMDTERVFNYRALRFARQDNSPLIGYDHDKYVLPSEADNREIEGIINEYKAQRQSTQLFFESMSSEMLSQQGVANDVNLSVRGIGYIISGHELHHLKVIQERYLK